MLAFFFFFFCDKNFHALLDDRKELCSVGYTEFSASDVCSDSRPAIIKEPDGVHYVTGEMNQVG